MTISSYTTLSTSVAAWLDVSSSDISTVVSDLVTVAEKRIFREVRNTTMEAALSVTISSGSAAVPADFVELKYAYIDATPTQWLEMRPIAWVYERYPTRSAGGKPKFMAKDGSTFIFGPYPDSGYTVKGVYYKRLSEIQTSVNALLTNYPDLYLFACLAESEQLLGRDKRIPIWESKYRMIKDRVNAEDVASRFSSGMSVRTG